MAATKEGSGGGKANTPGTFAHTTGVQRVVGFTVVTFVLLAVADFPATEKLAVAFAYLIMVSTIVAAGGTAFGRISSLVNGG